MFYSTRFHLGTALLSLPGGMSCLGLFPLIYCFWVISTCLGFFPLFSRFFIRYTVFALFRSCSWVLDWVSTVVERCIWVYTLFTLLCCLGTALLQIVGIALLGISV